MRYAQQRAPGTRQEKAVLLVKMKGWKLGQQDEYREAQRRIANCKEKWKGWDFLHRSMKRLLCYRMLQITSDLHICNRFLLMVEGN